MQPNLQVGVGRVVRGLRAVVQQRAGGGGPALRGGNGSSVVVGGVVVGMLMVSPRVGADACIAQQGWDRGAQVHSYRVDDSPVHHHGLAQVPPLARRGRRCCQGGRRRRQRVHPPVRKLQADRRAGGVLRLRGAPVGGLEQGVAHLGCRDRIYDRWAR